MRLDIKTKELREKDNFVKSVIVARARKDANETELHYLTERLEEFINLHKMG